MLTGHRRRIAWITFAALLLQVLAMSVHHVAYGKLAAPNATASAAHDSGAHNHGQGAADTAHDESSPCPFWLTLHSTARYVPPLVVAANVRPVTANIVIGFETPIITPQYLLTDLSSRGPPRLVDL